MNKQWKRIVIMLYLLSAALAADVGLSISSSLTPGNPISQPPTVTLQALEEEVYDISIASSGEANGKTYVLQSSGVALREGPDYFIWRSVGQQSATHYAFKVVNTHLTPAQTRVRVECVWVAESTGGGGGGGGEVDKIEGWAEGNAQVLSSDQFWVEANDSPAVVAVGSQLGVNAYAGNRLSVAANWTKESGVGDFVGSHTEKSSVNYSSEDGGSAVVRGTYCDNTDLFDFETLTFVEVVSISADPAIVCLGTTPEFTVTTSPGGYEDLVNIAFDPNTPGVQEIVATCGTSSKSTWVTVVGAIFDESEVVKCVADGAYNAAANLTEDSYDPEGFVWSLTTIEGDETAEINEETGYVTFGEDWGRYAIRVAPKSLSPSTCFAQSMLTAFMVQLESTETSLANHPSPVDPNDIYSYTQVTAQSLPSIDGLNISAEIVYADPDIEGENGEIASFAPSGDAGKYISVYEAKTETQANKCASDPVLSDQTIKLAPFINDQQCGTDHSLCVMSYFRKLKSKDQFNEAIEYVSNKYNINQAATYDPALQSDGETDEYGSVRIGPRAFWTENMLASTLIHEQTHVSQGYPLIMAAKAAQALYYLGVRNPSVCPYPFVEIEALMSEQDNFTRTCLSASEQQNTLTTLSIFQDIANECGCY